MATSWVIPTMREIASSGVAGAGLIASRLTMHGAWPSRWARTASFASVVLLPAPVGPTNATVPRVIVGGAADTRRMPATRRSTAAVSASTASGPFASVVGISSSSRKARGSSTPAFTSHE